MPNCNPFPAALLEKNKHRHSLSDNWNWHHTCWQYGRGNIFETLYKAELAVSPSNKPKVFTLADPPSIDRTSAACMMPFVPQFDDVYQTISAACRHNSLSCLRVDEIYGIKPIIADVVDTIDRAGLVICDLTGRNPNVLYETGISHAIGRDTIIIAQDIGNDVPFDLQHLPCISYDVQNQAGRDALQVKLRKTIATILAEH